MLKSRPVKYCNSVSRVNNATAPPSHGAIFARVVASKNNPAPDKMKHSAVLYCIGAVPGSICKTGRQCACQPTMINEPNIATAAPADRAKCRNIGASAHLLTNDCGGIVQINDLTPIEYIHQHSQSHGVFS